MRTASLALTGFLIAAMPLAASAEPETYAFDPSHTTIAASWNHFGFSTGHLRFTDYEGELVLDRDAPEASRISVTIDAASLESGFEDRDNHFRTADFFDVENHPEITFESTAVTLAGENAAKVEGELTIKGITKPVTLDVTLNRIGESPVMPDMFVAGFDASTTVLRSDFGLGLYAPAVSDEVVITISTEMVRK